MSIKLICAAFFSLFVFTTAAQRNVILIIADDLGLDYLGFYENHLDTVAMPNVRRLLNRGVRFTNTWSNPLCSPTRAGILTGRHSFRTGVGTAVKTGTSVLGLSETTIPRLLNIYKPNGFAKANIGKWHLQMPVAPYNYLFPTLMGYDHYEGLFTGSLPNYYSWTKVSNAVANNCTNYATTEIANNAIAWVKANQTQPFFLWLAFNAPHTPYHLPPAGLYSDTTLTGTAADISNYPRKYFKASVEALDHEIGRLFDTLQLIQKWDSTDVIFIGDNGDDQLIVQTTGNGRAKGSLYQAGVCVPLIVSGPSVVNPHRVSHALVNTHDLFATILELFGYSAWQTQISSLKPVDSKSLLQIIKNQTDSIRPWAFTEVFGATLTGDGKAMRNANYKLLDFDDGSQKFYNLTNDANEQQDLLLDTLSAADSSNYSYLCAQMKNLTNTTGYCILFGDDSITEPENNLLVYPNPFYSYIYVNAITQQETVQLTNCMGQLIFSGKNIQQQNFSYLPEGIYFFKISGHTNKVVKLVKGW